MQVHQPGKRGNQKDRVLAEAGIARKRRTVKRAAPYSKPGEEDTEFNAVTRLFVSTRFMRMVGCLLKEGYLQANEVRDWHESERVTCEQVDTISNSSINVEVNIIFSYSIRPPSHNSLSVKPLSCNYPALATVIMASNVFRKYVLVHILLLRKDALETEKAALKATPLVEAMVLVRSISACPVALHVPLSTADCRIVARTDVLSPNESKGSQITVQAPVLGEDGSRFLLLLCNAVFDCEGYRRVRISASELSYTYTV
jgi:hypothetical protein